MSRDPRNMTGFIDPETGERHRSFRDAALAKINRPEPGANAVVMYGLTVTPRRLALFLVACVLSGLIVGVFL